MEIDRKELKLRARERMALADPKFWIVALTYLALTTGVSWLFSLIPLPDSGTMVDTFQIFLQLLLMLYTTVVRFGLCLWALWTYRQLNPGLGSLIQGFSVAGRVILMELGIYIRVLGWYFLIFILLGTPAIAVLIATDGSMLGFAGLLLFAAVLVAVLIMVNLRYALTPYLLADRPDDGPSLPLFRSARLMRGWKWELFKLEFSFIGWDIINALLSWAVTGFFLWQAGLLSVDAITSLSFDWADACQAVIYSAPVVILSTLVTVPLSLWLLPYRSTARAGFYDARLAAARNHSQIPEMPPL